MHNDARLFLSADDSVLTRLVTAAFITLWIATALAAWSLAIYMANVWSHFIYPQALQQKQARQVPAGSKQDGKQQ